MESSIPHSREPPTALIHHFLLVVLLRGSGLADCGASPKKPFSPSSATGAWSLYSNCRSAGGEGAALLLLEVASFQPSWENLFPYTRPQSLAAPPSVQFGLSLLQGLWEDPAKLKIWSFLTAARMMLCLGFVTKQC